MKLQDIEKLHSDLIKMEIKYYLEESLFSFEWWLLLIALILPWILWFKFVDRKRFKEIILFGLLWMVMALVLDEIGASWNLWSYPKKLIPIIPPFAPADLSVIPVAFMIIYQWSKNFRIYFLLTIITSLLFSFVIEVSFQQFGMFKLLNWEHWYSFIGFIIVSCFIWWLHGKLNKMNEELT